MMFFVVFVLAVVLTIGGARMAESRGRSGAGWGVGTLFMGAVGFALGSALFALLLEHDESGMGTLTLFASFAPAAGALAFMLGALGYIHTLLPRVIDLGQWFPVYRMASKERDGVDGVLRFGADGVRFEPAGDEAAALVIPYAQLELAVADGEAVRLNWQPAGEPAAPLLLVPTHGPDTRDWRIRQSAMLARRIAELRASAR